MKKIELLCNCNFHKIVIEEVILNNGDNFLNICVYNHKSFKTGKILKNPIILGDVILCADDVKKLKDILLCQKE